MPCSRRAWTLLVALLSPLAWSAPEDHYAHFESIGDLQSVPDGVVTALAEDAQGFLWIGTPRGLVRFDGYDFRRYTHRRDAENSLAGNLIRSLLATADGKLWIGTDADGLSLFDPASERFVGYRHLSDDPAGLPPGGIMAISRAPDGGIWLGTRGGGLVRLDAVDGSLRAIRQSREGELPAPQDFIHALRFDADGALWIGSRAGLARLDPHSDSPEPLLSETGEALHGESVYSLMQSSDGRIWIGTQSGRLVLLDAKTQQVSLPAGDASIVPGMLDTISAITQLDNGEVWLGRATGIEVRSSKSGAVLRRLRHDPGRSSGLAANEIRVLLPSRSGLLWVGSFGGGVQRHDPANQSIQVLRGQPGHAGVFESADIASILQRSNGEIWLGTRGNGVAVLNTALQLVDGFAAQPERPDALAVGWITAMIEAPDAAVWLGSREGLHRFDPVNRRFERRFHDPEAMPLSVRRLAFDQRAQLWIGTNEGLYRVRPQGDAIERVTLPHDQALLGEFNALVVDAAGRLWIGASTGLFMAASGADAVINVQGRSEIDLTKKSVVGLLVDRDDRLWADTTQGLFRAQITDAASLDFQPVRPDFGAQTGDFGANLLQDAKGRLWTHRLVLDEEQGWLHELGRSDGVVFGTGWFRSYAKLQDGRLLFGGSRGLLVVQPELFEPWTYAPPLVVSGLSIDGSAQPVARLTPTLRMLPGEDSFSVEFAALDYSDPKRLRYAYRLHGVDRDWVETDAARRSANYRNLWPGDYRLQIRGSNRSGQWSAQQLDLRLQIVPAWWQTPWFAAGMLLLAALGVAGGMRWRLRYIRQRAAQLEILVENRTEELLRAKESAEYALSELKRTQFQLAAAEKMASLGQLVAGVAHEINTPVGIAVTAASHLEQLTRKAESALEEGRLTRSDLDQWRAAVKEGTTLILGSLERASRLIGSFKQVAVDQSSEQRRRLDLCEFLLEVSIALSPSYRRTGHQLEIDCAAGIELDTYPGALFQILTNLVSNSLLHGFAERSNGLMRVEARVQGEHLLLRYRDDGCGMTAEIAAHAFEPFFTTRRGSGGSGLGLHLVYNLCTQLLGGSIELQTAPGDGVQVVMILPLCAPAMTSESDSDSAT